MASLLLRKVLRPSAGLCLEPGTWNLEAEKPESLWACLVPTDAACWPGWISVQSGRGDALAASNRWLSMPTDGSARALYVFFPAISRVNNFYLYSSVDGSRGERDRLWGTRVAGTTNSQ